MQVPHSPEEDVHSLFGKLVIANMLNSLALRSVELFGYVGEAVAVIDDDDKTVFIVKDKKTLSLILKTVLRMIKNSQL